MKITTTTNLLRAHLLIHISQTHDLQEFIPILHALRQYADAKSQLWSRSSCSQIRKLPQDHKNTNKR